MRVLVATNPGFGHMFPPVAISWALRAAGHEVLFATAGSIQAEITALSGAGLPIAEILTVPEIEEHRRQQLAKYQDQGVDLAQLIAESQANARAAAHGNGGLEFAAPMWAPVSDAMADNLLTIAQDFRPDLIIHTPLQGAAVLTAAKLGIPAVEQHFGLVRLPELAPALHTHLKETYHRHGLTDLPARRALLDTAPPSIAMGAPQPGWPMRYIPFNGGGPIPTWLREKPTRPRIAVTLGTALPTQTLNPLSQLPEAAQAINAEFILALPKSTDPAALGDLPGNVRPIGYLPLTQLLATCTAVIHHGGAGTTMTALDHGLPQLALPQGADQFVNAEALRRRGNGLVPADGEMTTDLIDQLLTDQSLHTAAKEVQAELHSMPTPAAVVPHLEEFAN